MAEQGEYLFLDVFHKSVEGDFKDFRKKNPLDPGIDWDRAQKEDEGSWLAWDEERGCYTKPQLRSARLGELGWEMVSIWIRYTNSRASSSNPTSSTFIFKRPR